MPRLLGIALVSLIFTGCVTPALEVTGGSLFELSSSDVREIVRLVDTRRDILKPVSRIMADYTGHAVVTSGRRGHAGEPIDIFQVARRDGRWQIDSDIRHDHAAVALP